LPKQLAAKTIKGKRKIHFPLNANWNICAVLSALQPAGFKDTRAGAFCPNIIHIQLIYTIKKAEAGRSNAPVLQGCPVGQEDTHERTRASTVRIYLFKIIGQKRQA